MQGIVAHLTQFFNDMAFCIISFCAISGCVFNNMKQIFDSFTKFWVLLKAIDKKLICVCVHGLCQDK